MKKITGIYSAPAPHWVGDGFPVRSMFSWRSHGAHVSPFLLLDHAGPMKFGPATRPRGVGQHSHRGFETVTIVYDGEIEHRDSTGAGGKIGPGDVQWMTAASGILHEEFHSHEFTRTGGTLEMVQLWVNLPAADKMSDPAYQTLLAADIPQKELPDGAGCVRVIAGHYRGREGAAHTFTPVNVWDVQLNHSHAADFEMPPGHTTAVVVLRGTVEINGTAIAREAQMALLSRQGSGVHLEANSDARLLMLGGEPIDEPIVGHGPFVMNTKEEIYQAFEDFSSGRFGQLRPSA